MTTKKRHCQHPSTSFSDALLFQSLSDLIGQSVCGCGCIVLGYSGQAGA